MRKIGNKITPTQNISIDNDEICIKTTSTFKTTEIKFFLGKEFVEVTADGCNVKVPFFHLTI